MPSFEITSLPAQTPVTLRTGTVVETSGLSGTVAQPSAGRSGLRSPGSPAGDEIHPRLAAALAELAIEEQETVFLDVAPSAASRRLRTTASTEDRVVLQPAAPIRPDVVQIVLYQDESGGVSWHLPDRRERVGGTMRATRSRGRGSGSSGARFTIACRTASARAPRTAGNGRRLRGKITSLGRKVFKILLLPVLSYPVGAAMQAIVGAVERKHRQNLIRSLTPENYRQRVSEPFTDWSSLAGGRTLLLVHGIFSSTEGVLAEFPAGAMHELSANYQGRMISFDQWTVSCSPEENARWFLQQLCAVQPSGHFEFDILCHSRGGIVARTLAERGRDLVPGHPAEFRKVFFVATPNRGSVLADPEHLVDLVDTYTNIITSFPDGPVAYSIETVLALLKLVVQAAETHLPGLAAMGTGTYIKELNAARTPSPAAYAAAASDYTPDPQAENGFITGRFANRVIDRIFKAGSEAVANDLVVPCNGVFAANGHPSFPIVNPLTFGASDHVWHGGFFSRPETLAAIKRHFDAAEPETFYELASAAGTAVAADGLPSVSAEKGNIPESFDPEAARRRPRLRGKRDAAPLAQTPKPPKPPKPPRGPTAPPAAVLPSAELERDPKIDFHESVVAGTPNVLTVRLDDLAPSADLSRILRIQIPAGQDQVIINVTLAAPGFEVETLNETTMTVKATRDPALEIVQFRLTAHHPGPEPVRRELTAHFWLGHSCIGAVGHRTMVHPQGFAGLRQSDGSSFSSGFFVPPTRRDDCDLTISVQGDDEEGRPPFRVTMSCAIPGHEYSDLYAGKLVLDEPGDTLESYLGKFYKRQFDDYPGDELSDAEFDVAYARWAEQFEWELNALGTKLWEFLPDRFRNEYFRLHRAGVPLDSILVHSDEMIFPWELLVPHEVVDGKLVKLPPLGRKHVLGRWKPGLRIKPQPQHFVVSKFCVVSPQYAGDDALPSAEEETKELTRRFPQITVLRPATLRTFRTKLLDESDVHVFHFNGHGEFAPDNADLNHLVLEDGDRLDALLVNHTRLGTEACPIVFLNACHAGRTGKVVGRTGGFAANFLKSGCSGIIAPYWPVDDVVAARFSLELYDRLAQGHAIGAALRDLRVAHAKDTTYSAFGYIGDPWAKLDLRGLQPPAARGSS